eukprot:TRINITY_DN80853_c0_g1_i1.p1 TRINITY_DN80853_c0_g1~~TRINITY_DN80853_c0_g1_i1.p1  ORF type:complete len:118 (-),score=3.54 TRINITY_DN80853_c0_g1_i1:81-434(-)
MFHQCAALLLTEVMPVSELQSGEDFRAEATQLSKTLVNSLRISRCPSDCTAWRRHHCNLTLRVLHEEQVTYTLKHSRGPATIFLQSKRYQISNTSCILSNAFYFILTRNIRVWHQIC